MINKKGFLFVFWIIGFLVIALIVLTLILIFNKNIRDTIQIIGDFLSDYGIWIMVGVLLIIFKDVVIEMVMWIFSLIKSIFAKVGLG